LWGDPDKQPDVWKRHNPYDLAPQLGGTRLYISSGNGQPGPLDLEGAVTDQIEPESEKRTPRSLAGSVTWGSRRSSTFMETALTTGCTGSARCTGRGR